MPRIMRNLVIYPFGIIGMMLVILGFLLYDVAQQLIKINSQQQEH